SSHRLAATPRSTRSLHDALPIYKGCARLMTSPSRETPRTVRRDHSGTGCRGQAGAKTPVPGRGSLTPNPGARSGDRRPGRTKEVTIYLTHPGTMGSIAA